MDSVHVSVRAKARPRRRGASLEANRRRFGYILLTPAVIVLALLTLYPTLYMLFISFHQWSIIPTLPRPFIGLKQYSDILQNPEFLNTLRVTGIFVFATVVFEMIAGFVVAMLLYVEHKGVRLMRLPFLVPAMIAPVVVGLIWRLMLHYDLGIINYLIASLGLPKVIWLGLEVPALVSVILVDVWQWTPFTGLIMLAGLQSLPNEPFEAAYVEGASRLQTLRYLTLPMLLPVITIALMFRTLDSFKTFDIIYMVTRGGPASATNVLAYNIWRKGFFENRLGTAAALSVVMILIATLVTQVFNKLLSKQASE